MWEVRGDGVTELRLDPSADLGLARITIDDIRGGDAAANAQVVREVLAGRGGAARETVLLNAAAAIVADGTLQGTASGTIVERFEAALEHAAVSVESGAAAAALDRWVAASAA